MRARPRAYSADSCSGTVWFVSQVLGRHENSTGHLLAQLTEALARDFRVATISSIAGAKDEPEHPRSFGRRALQAALQSLSLSLRAFRSARRGDVVVVLTNPPLLPAVVSGVAALRGIKVIVLVHDVYPEAAYAAGLPARHRLPARLFDLLNTSALRRADRVIVIGRDMERLLSRKLGAVSDHLEYIPNWPDVDLVPDLDQLEGNDPVNRRFVVQYSGKIGLTHDADMLAEAAALLMERASEIRLHVFGWGAGLKKLHDNVQRRGLDNIEIHPPCARPHLGHQLRSCDIGLILMRPGMTGVSVPCRVYNLLAAGRPVIVAADAGSELARVVRSARAGWVVEPDDPGDLVQAICEAATDAEELTRMGARARAAAEKRYGFARALDSYRRVIADVACPESSPPGG